MFKEKNKENIWVLEKIGLPSQKNSTMLVPLHYNINKNKMEVSAVIF